MYDKKTVNKILEIFKETGCTVNKITIHTQGVYDEVLNEFVEAPIYVLHLDKFVPINEEDRIVKLLKRTLSDEFIICGNGDWISQF
jgi:hypothetical protein